MPQLDTKRLFLAVEIPKKIQDYLEELENRLQESGCDARWVKPGNIHLTLKFLGAVGTHDIERLTQAMTSSLQAYGSFCVTLDKLGAFPSIKAPRILWLGINDKEEKIKKIVFELENALAELDFASEARKFKAHLTLARLRSDQNKLNLIEKIQEANETIKYETLLINNVTLFESFLTPKGPVYTHIHQMKLRGL